MWINHRQRPESQQLRAQRVPGAAGRGFKCQREARTARMNMRFGGAAAWAAAAAKLAWRVNIMGIIGLVTGWL